MSWSRTNNRRQRLSVTRTMVPVIASGLLIGTVATASSAAAAAIDPSRLVTPADVPAAIGTAMPGSKTYVVEEPALYGLQVCNDSGSDWDVQVPGPSTFTVGTFGLGEEQRAGVGQFVYRFPSSADAQNAWTKLKRASAQCKHRSTSQLSGYTITTTLTTGFTCPGVKAFVCSGGPNEMVWVNHANRYKDMAKYGDPIDRLAIFSLADDAIIVTASWRMAAIGSNPAFNAAQKSALRDLATVLTDRWKATAP